MANTFMDASKKNQESQKQIEQNEQSEQVKEEVEMSILNLRVPKDLHYQAKLHRLNTGESVTALVTRLLKKEFS